MVQHIQYNLGILAGIITLNFPREGILAALFKQGIGAGPARHCNGKVLETRLKFSYTGLGEVWVIVQGCELTENA